MAPRKKAQKDETPAPLNGVEDTGRTRAGRVQWSSPCRGRIQGSRAIGGLLREAQQWTTACQWPRGLRTQD